MRLGLSGQEGEAGNGGIVDLAIDIGEASTANRIEYKTTWWGARFARRPPQPTGQQFVRQTLGAARPQRRPARRRQRLHLQPRVAACGGACQLPWSSRRAGDVSGRNDGVMGRCGTSPRICRPGPVPGFPRSASVRGRLHECTMARGDSTDQERAIRFRTVEWCHSPPRAVRMPRALSVLTTHGHPAGSTDRFGWTADSAQDSARISPRHRDTDAAAVFHAGAPTNAA